MATHDSKEASLLDEIKKVYEDSKTNGLITRWWHHIDFIELVKKGYLDVIKYCIEHGRPWNPETTFWAVRSGNLKTLKFCHELGCRWGSGTTRAAAKYNELEMLQYCNQHGCPWDYDTSYWVVVKGNVAILEYLYEQEILFYNVDSKEIHEDSKEFLNVYGRAWMTGKFDVPLHWVKPAKI